MEKQTMGKFMQSLRKAKGYSQQSVAEKLGVSNKTVSSWECDNTAPDLYMLPAIAELYGVSLDELIKGQKSEAEIPTVSKKAYDALMTNLLIKYNARFLMILILLIIGIALPIIGNSLWFFVGSKGTLILDILFSFFGMLLVIFVFIMEHYNINTFLIKTDVDDDIKYKYWEKALKTHIKFNLIIMSVILSVPLIIMITCGYNETHEIYYNKSYLISSAVTFVILWTSFICLSKYYMHDYNNKLKSNRIFNIQRFIINCFTFIFILVYIVILQSYIKYNESERSAWSSDIVEIMEKPRHLSRLDESDSQFIIDKYTLIKEIVYKDDIYYAYVLTSEYDDEDKYKIDTLIMKNSEYIIGKTTTYFYGFGRNHFFIHLNMNMEYEAYNSYWYSIINLVEKKKRKAQKISFITITTIADVLFLSGAIYLFIKRRKNN